MTLPKLNVLFTTAAVIPIAVRPFLIFNHNIAIMAQNPREQWERLQLILKQRGARGGFGFGGLPSGGGRGGLGLAAALLVGGGVWALSNSLFNGEIPMDAVLLCTNWLLILSS